MCFAAVSFRRLVGALSVLLASAFALQSASAFAADAASPAAVDVAPFVRQPTYVEAKISPDGRHLAVTVPTEDRTVLVVLRREDMKATTKIAGGRDSVIHDFWWANDERLLAALAEKVGIEDTPRSTGEIHAINIDGSRGGSLTGLAHYTVAELEAVLPEQERAVLITAAAYGERDRTVLEKLDVYSGRRSPVAVSPVAYARFVVDPAGHARFAFGFDNKRDNSHVVFYRDEGGSEWRLIADERKTRLVEIPLGFSVDGRIAYLQVERPGKPDAIVAWDIGADVRTEVASDPVVDPHEVLRDGAGHVIGASFMHDDLRTVFFDPGHAWVKAWRQLQRAFPGESVNIVSATRDDTLLVVQVSSDRNPGDYHLFDTAAKKVLPLFARRLWLDPADMAPTRAVSFSAADGLRLNGYLTLPRGAAEGVPQPMVLLPHGGPFGVADAWWFDSEVQLLAAAGYAVLRVNYRGSSGYGRDHEEAGAREWGKKLQSDLTDATRWAVAQKVADPERICIYGASYGAYAALMGAATEPELYRCVAGYVGVYDIAEHHKRISGLHSAYRTWAEQWLGPREDMAQISVADKAERIRVPVFLAAGGKDEIAPIKQTEAMEKALRGAGADVSTLYYPQEGHGFYNEEHRQAFYARLLNFLAAHLGGAPAR